MKRVAIVLLALGLVAAAASAPAGMSSKKKKRGDCVDKVTRIDVREYAYLCDNGIIVKYYHSGDAERFDGIISGPCGGVEVDTRSKGVFQALICEACECE